MKNRDARRRSRCGGLSAQLRVRRPVAGVPARAHERGPCLRC